MMRAAVLQQDRSLKISTVPLPELRARSVIVQVLAVQLPPFTVEVLSGLDFPDHRAYGAGALAYGAPKPPVILGSSAVGRVVSVADDVHDISPGDTVFCDPVIGHHSNNGCYDFILQSWLALGPDSLATQELYRDGTFAEQFVTTAECLTVIRNPGIVSPVRWSTLAYVAVAYGALSKGDFRQDRVPETQVVAVAGTTGGIGGCAVLLALTNGASKVIAMGRHEAALQRLVQLDPRRVTAVRLNSSQDPADALKAALGTQQADLAVDAVGEADTLDIALACLHNLKRGGIVVLDGFMPVPYGVVLDRELQIRGAFMADRSAPGTVIRLVEYGLLDLGRIKVDAFPLVCIDQCVRHARQCSALRFAVLEPCK